MSPKNSLTINNNKLLIKESKRAVLTQTGAVREILGQNKVAFDVSSVSASQLKGNFFIPKISKFYELTTQKAKNPLGKVDQKNERKDFNTGILAQIQGAVKSIFGSIRFFLTGKRNLTDSDVQLLTTLVEKHKGNVPIAWQEFWQITGTNFKTFNE